MSIVCLHKSHMFQTANALSLDSQCKWHYFKTWYRGWKSCHNFLFLLISKISAYLCLTMLWNKLQLTKHLALMQVYDRFTCMLGLSCVIGLVSSQNLLVLVWVAPLVVILSGFRWNLLYKAKDCRACLLRCFQILKCLSYKLLAFFLLDEWM